MRTGVLIFIERHPRHAHGRAGTKKDAVVQHGVRRQHVTRPITSTIDHTTPTKTETQRRNAPVGGHLRNARHAVRAQLRLDLGVLDGLPDDHLLLHGRQRLEARRRAAGALLPFLHRLQPRRLPRPRLVVLTAAVVRGGVAPYAGAGPDFLAAALHCAAGRRELRSRSHHVGLGGRDSWARTTRPLGRWIGALGTPAPPPGCCHDLYLVG